MPEPAISVHELRKRYGPVTALDGVSFDVPRGSVLGLLGPNGSGKTTTVGILSTAIRSDGGRATVGGLDVVTQAAQVRAAIGFAGQYAAVDGNLTGRENLTLIGRLSRLPRRSAPGRAGELLGRFGLTDAADRRVRTYSGGMRRRLDVAAALVHRPPVLFLDEPTAGLDPESRLGLWDMVRDLLAEGATVLLTTQYLEEADALADQIVIIDHGRVIDEGTPAQLKARTGSAVAQLTFADESVTARAQQALAARSMDSERSGCVVRVKAASSGAVVAVLRALDDPSLDPVSVEVHEPTLDEVFLALTGQPSESTSNLKGAA